MGIDAQMFVRHKGNLSSAEVRKLSGDLAAAFYQDAFYIFRPDNSFYKKGRHALEIIKRYEQDGDPIKPEKGEQFIEVHLSTRYYGEDYERGDWPNISAVARWLRVRIPGCSVWYGGDSSGVCAEEMTPLFEEKMWAHFIENGHEPYVERDRPSMGDGPRPTCTFCNRIMWNNSWGPDETRGYLCEGCGYECKTTDNGKTYQEVKEKEPGTSVGVS